MNTVRPYSSHIDAIHYEGGALVVEWQNGSRTIYSGVPPDVAQRVLSSQNASYGQALHTHIRGRYPHKTVKVGDD